MTLKINIAHATPGYSAAAVIAGDAHAPGTTLYDSCSAETYIHSGKSAVVHEVQSENDSIEQAEERALQRMWNGYSEAAGGKTFDGKDLPTWDELGEERQACWRAALRAL
jgi:hypothetical protein